MRTSHAVSIIISLRMTKQQILSFIAYIPFPAGLTTLKRLSLAFNKITDACLVHLKGSSYLKLF